mgnify:CR=1 FL=1
MKNIIKQLEELPNEFTVEMEHQKTERWEDAYEFVIKAKPMLIPPISIAIRPITTRSSTKEKPLLFNVLILLLSSSQNLHNQSWCL